MIISTKRGTPQAELERIIREFEAQGLSVTMIRGTDYNVFGLVGDTTVLDEKRIRANPMWRAYSVFPSRTKRRTACSTRQILSSTWRA